MTFGTGSAEEEALAAARQVRYWLRRLRAIENPVPDPPVALSGWAASSYEDLEACTSMAEVQECLSDLKLCLQNQQALLRIQAADIRDRDRQVSVHAGRNGRLLVQVRKLLEGTGMEAPPHVTDIPKLVKRLLERT